MILYLPRLIPGGARTLQTAYRRMAKASFRFCLAVTASGCGGAWSGLDEYLRLHPELTSTQAEALATECPVPGLPVRALSAIWGQPITGDLEEPVVTWQLEAGVTVSARSDAGAVAEAEVVFDKPWREVARRIGGMPDRIVEYLGADSAVRPGVRYGLLRGCIWEGMSEGQVDLVRGWEGRLLSSEEDLRVKSYMAGYEGQKFVVEFRNARVARWDYCAGVMSDRRQGPLCGIPPSR